jgi:hypothetical protein
MIAAMGRTIPSVVLFASLTACSSSPTGVGLTGTPKYRDEDPVVATDMKSVSLRKGALVTKHDLVAREHCGGDCRYQRRAFASLELALEPNGVVSASNEGEQLEEFRSAAGGTKHHLEWERTWSGSWTEGQGRVVLTLRPDTTACEQQAADSEATEDPCKAVPLKLVCEGRKIELYRPKHKRERVWVCRPRGHVMPEPGMTPFPWVFGVDRPLEMSDRSLGARTQRYILSDAPEPKKKRGKPAG